jgi:circadian clock protein KaiC
MLANQLCFHGARNGERALYVTLLAETHERMLTHLQRMQFFDASFIPDKVYFISAFRALQQDGLPALLRLLRDAIIDRKASILIIDGMVTAEEVSLSRTASSNTMVQDAGSSQQFKQFIHELQTVCSMTGCTVMLLSSTERPRLFHPAYTMVDGILELTNELSGLKTLRQIHVRKMRGTDQVLGKHHFEIRDTGVVVHPRLETQLHRPSRPNLEHRVSTQRVPFGVERLDDMLGGGLPPASTTMVVGPTGTGKTLLGAQFLSEGARAGEPGVYFGFYERPSALLEKGRRLGLDLEKYAQAGSFEIVWQRPIEAVMDELADRMFTSVRKLKAKRLVIDGIQGFEFALDDYPDRVRGAFAAMSDELERLGVTTLYTVETREVFGPTIEIPVTGVSAATQNIILLRHVELRSRLRLLLSILKVRDSQFDRTVRELLITDNGLVVDDTFGADEQVLSLSALYPSSASLRHNTGRSASLRRNTTTQKRRTPAGKRPPPARKAGKRKR